MKEKKASSVPLLEAPSGTRTPQSQLQESCVFIHSIIWEPTMCWNCESDTTSALKGLAVGLEIRTLIYPFTDEKTEVQRSYAMLKVTQQNTTIGETRAVFPQFSLELFSNGRPTLLRATSQLLFETLPSFYDLSFCAPSATPSPKPEA